MRDYIEREAAMAAACKALCHPGVLCPDFKCAEVRDAFNAIPAADVRPVVRGKWLNDFCGNYPQYGGRGIKVCDEWHYIDVFAEWVERSGYKEGLTLDRINPNGDYTPENCRWATRKQQANNRRNTVYITIDGVTKTLAEWADFAGIKRSVMADRYFCKAIRGVALLHKVEDTRFKKGYNRYKFKGHWDDAPTIIPAEEGE